MVFVFVDPGGYTDDDLRRCQTLILKLNYGILFLFYRCLRNKVCEYDQKAVVGAYGVQNSPEQTFNSYDLRLDFGIRRVESRA